MLHPEHAGLLARTRHHRRRQAVRRLLRSVVPCRDGLAARPRARPRDERRVPEPPSLTRKKRDEKAENSRNESKNGASRGRWLDAGAAAARDGHAAQGLRSGGG